MRREPCRASGCATPTGRRAVSVEEQALSGQSPRPREERHAARRVDDRVGRGELRASGLRDRTGAAPGPCSRGRRPRPGFAPRRGARSAPGSGRPRRQERPQGTDRTVGPSSIARAEPLDAARRRAADHVLGSEPTSGGYGASPDAARDLGRHVLTARNLQGRGQRHRDDHPEEPEKFARDERARRSHRQRGQHDAAPDQRRIRHVALDRSITRDWPTCETRDSRRRSSPAARGTDRRNARDDSADDAERATLFSETETPRRL